jgi:alcohol dehydrogenase class IV
MQFEFLSITRIIFGSGKLNSIAEIAKEFGNKAFILYGCPKTISDRLNNLLNIHGYSCLSIKIAQEPTIDLIRYLVEAAKQFSPDLVIGIGGGSALDSAKAAAIFLSNPGEITDYLEIIGKGKPILSPSVPIITIPTTSGTGAEVTKNAVIASPHHSLKISLRSPNLFPKVALIDPELTIILPPEITAFTGMDALTQLIEPFTCNLPNPITDALCYEGIQRIRQSIYQAFDNGKDIQARENMSLASLFSGLALANAKLGAVHGLAGPIGGEISAPHGAICACLLPLVMEENLKALQARTPDHPTLDRFGTIGKILCNHSSATAQDGLDWIRKFNLQAKIPQLSAFGLTEEMSNIIIEKAIHSSSMKGNPITLTDIELRNILQKSL